MSTLKKPGSTELNKAAKLIEGWTADFDKIKDSIDGGSARKTKRAKIEWERRFASYLVVRSLWGQGKRLVEYQSAVNKIDDFFEYTYKGGDLEEARKRVLEHIDELTKNLKGD